MKKILVMFLALLMLTPISAVADTITYEIAASVDDTWGYTATGFDINDFVNSGATEVGRYSNYGLNINNYMFGRWIATLPRCSKISATNISFYANYTSSGTFNTTIQVLTSSGSPAWKNSNGFNTTNYANCTALLAIAKSATVAWSPASWTSGTWYDTPDTSAVLQAEMDNTSYDPTSATDKYIGFHIDDGDGTYVAVGATMKARLADAWDTAGTNEPELDITYTARPAANVGNFWQIRGGVVKYRGY